MHGRSRSASLLNFWTFAATLGKHCFLLERTRRFASKQRTSKVLTSLSNGPENAAFTAHRWKEGTFIGHTMSVITDQFTKAKMSLDFYPKFTFSHSLALTCLQKARLLLCHQMVDYRRKCEAVVKLRFSNMPPSAKSMTLCLLGGGNGRVQRRRNERSSGLPHLICFSTFHFTLSIHFPAPKIIRIIHVLQRCL